MARALAALLLAPLAGCVGAGASLHQTDQFDDFFAGFNAAHAGQLAAPHTGIPTTAGFDAQALILPYFTGYAFSAHAGSSTATAHDGSTHTVDLSTSDHILIAGYPAGFLIEPPGRRWGVALHGDLLYRKTRVQIRERTAAGQATTTTYAGSASGVRPGATAYLALVQHGPVSLRGQVYAGYDLALFSNAPLAGTDDPSVYLSRDYGRGEATVFSRRAARSDVRGLTLSAGLALAVIFD